MSRYGTVHKGGRPKGSVGTHTIEVSKAREYVVKRVVAELDPIMTAQIDAAKGLYYEETDKFGKKHVYAKEPDLGAAKNLLDQAIGRAKETVEMQGDFTLKIDV